MKTHQRLFNFSARVVVCVHYDQSKARSKAYFQSTSGNGKDISTSDTSGADDEPPSPSVELLSSDTGPHS